MYKCTVCRNDKCAGIPAVSQADSLPASVDRQVSMWPLCGMYALCIVDDCYTGARFTKSGPDLQKKFFLYILYADISV